MKHTIQIESAEKVIGLGSEIFYGNRVEWCGATWRPLRMSLMRSRQFFYYDEPETLPVIVFFCGGGFTNVDHNVWMPELSWFAKRGYAIASVEYSTTARTRFPMQIEDAKLAIRYLRAHAKDYNIDPDRLVCMGESAGGYMSGLVALTGKDSPYDVGDYLDYSSAVKGAVCYYPGTDMKARKPKPTPPDPSGPVPPPDRLSYPSLPELVTPDSPPFLFLHGTADSQVPLEQSELLYDALQAKGIRSDLYIVEGAEHADAPFFQPEMKEIVIRFVDSLLK